MESFERLETVVFSAAEQVRAERQKLVEERLQAIGEKQKAEQELAAKMEQLQKEQARAVKGGEEAIVDIQHYSHM